MSRLFFPPVPKILRLLEDTKCYNENAKCYINLYKRDLLQEAAPAKDNKVLVKVLGDESSVPNYVPTNLVAEVEPGFYRAKSRVKHTRYPTIEEGEIVKVTRINMKKLGIIIPRGSWGVKMLNGPFAGYPSFCNGAVLEPVDNPDPEIIAKDAALNDSVWSAVGRMLFTSQGRHDAVRFRELGKKGSSPDGRHSELEDAIAAFDRLMEQARTTRALRDSRVSPSRRNRDPKDGDDDAPPPYSAESASDRQRTSMPFGAL